MTQPVLTIAQAFNAAYACFQSGNLQQAAYICGQILSVDPQNTDALHLQALISMQSGNGMQAVELLKGACAFKPDDVELVYNLGACYEQLAAREQALLCYRRAAEIKPDLYLTHFKVGFMLLELNKYSESLSAYQKAIELQPDCYEAHFGAGGCQLALSEGDQALESFERARQLKPSSISAVFGSCMANLPAYFDKEEDIDRARERYGKALTELESAIERAGSSACDDDMVVNLPFYLTSQGRNDRELQQRYGRIISKVMAEKYPQWSHPLDMPPLKDGERIRVGVTSASFSLHSHWKILIEGWARALDRQCFELYGYKTGGINDAITAQARNLFDHFVEGLSFQQLCCKVREDDLHVLLFPEIEMGNLKLAALRLAPVQCVSWGYPNTSGLPTIDFFLTSDLMEPEYGQEFYTEKLVRLPNLSTYYVPPDLKADREKLESYGVRKDSVRYLCVQSLHKYLPQHDQIFPRIAAAVPNAQFLFLARAEGVSRKLMGRLRKAFAAAGVDYERHVTFLPRLTQEEYCGLCAEGDVFLDTMEWSGGVTTLEALEQNTVPVTMPGKFMRGRHTYGILQMMGMTETVADTLDQYVEIAVKLGLDRDWRQTLSARIAERRTRLYRDSELASALEDFLKGCCSSYLPNS